MADYQPADTALGVSAHPLLSWIVPHCGAISRPLQLAYRILVSEERVQGGVLRHVPHWDSGRTVSNASVNVVYSGPSLAPGAAYSWNVTTWTVSYLSITSRASSEAVSARG